MAYKNIFSNKNKDDKGLSGNEANQFIALIFTGLLRYTQ
jgi:hypothetical protein